MAICDILVTINVLVVGIIYICKVQELPEKDPPPPPNNQIWFQCLCDIGKILGKINYIK